MTDREKLLTALLQESDQRSGAEISVLDVLGMLERLGAEHRRAEHRRAEHRKVAGNAATGASVVHTRRRPTRRSGARSVRVRAAAGVIARSGSGT